MEKKNQVLMTVLGVFALVIVTVGVSYAFFTYSRTSTTNNTINTTTQPISFGFTEEGGIALVDAVALPAATGKALVKNVYTIKINGAMPNNSDITYTITAINNTTTTGDQKALNDNQVRAYLTQGGAPVWTTTDDDNTDNNGTKLMSEILTTTNEDGTKEGELHHVTYTNNGQTPIADTYELRIWLDKSKNNDINANDNATGTIPSGDNYTTDGETVTSNQTNSTYSLKIRVDATAVANKAETVQP